MKRLNKSAILIYALITTFTCLSFCFFLPNYKISFYNYINPLFWCLTFILSFFLFRSDNVKKRYKYDFLQITIIYVIVYLMIYYLSGLIVGFAKLPYNHSFIGIIKNLISNVSIVFFMEYIRKCLINRSGKKKKLLIIITCIFAVFNIIYLSYGIDLRNPEVLFQFIFIILIGEFAKSAFLTYMTYKADIKASLIYAVPLQLIIYLVPIQPDLNWFLEGTFKLLLPYAIFITFNNFYEKKERIKSRNKNNGFVPIFISTVILVPLIILVSGVFKYQMVAVASNSMVPIFSRGDAIVFEKISNKDKKDLKEGQVIAFNKDNIRVLHRIMKIEYTSSGIKKYITKGDNNNGVDSGYIKDENIIGIVKFNVKFIGYPTVWLQEILK